MWEEFKALKPDLQVMAFVTLFVPEEFLNIPTHGSIQYHPSLLPAYRGACAINWPIIMGEKETGLSIFWPDNGLDTGDVLLQKKTPIGHRHARHRLFRPPVPDGRRGDAGSRRSGEGRQGAAHQAGRVEGDLRRPLRPDIAQHRLGQALAADRPPDPRLQSGARRLDDARRQDSCKIFDAKPLPAKDPKGIAGKMGEIVAVDADGFTVVCADGRFKVTRVQPPTAPKVDAGEWAKSPTSRQAQASHDTSSSARRGSRHARAWTDSQARKRSQSQAQRNSPCPPRSIRIRSPTSKSPRPPRSGRSSRSREKSSASRPENLEPYGHYKAKVSMDYIKSLQEQAERQADPGLGDHADAGGRRQDHHHGRPHRRAQPHRQEGDALPARAVARALASA